jgi:hypothetical protein
MKKTATIIFIFLTAYVQGQTNAPRLVKVKVPKQCVKVNLISPFVNTLSVFYQYNKNDENAWQFGVSVMTNFEINAGSAYSVSNNQVLYYSIANSVVNAQALLAEYRYSLKGNVANGSYIQPFTRILNAQIESDFSVNGQATRNKVSAISVGLGVLFGAQALLKDKITLDVYAGPVYAIKVSESKDLPAGIQLSRASDRGGLNDPIITGYGLRAGFTLGFVL